MNAIAPGAAIKPPSESNRPVRAQILVSAVERPLTVSNNKVACVGPPPKTAMNGAQLFVKW